MRRVLGLRMPSHKLYDVLGVPQGAGQDEIKKKFRALAIKAHPDKGGDPERFKEIAHAYEVLSDEDKRRQYDALGDGGFAQAQQGSGGGGGFDPHSIFEQFFGGFGGGFGGGGQRNNARQQCAHHAHVMSLSLAEAYTGVTKTVRVALTKACAGCRSPCYACNGVGCVQQLHRVGPFTQVSQQPCGQCQARGVTFKGCNACGSAGHTKEERRIEVVLPPGVSTGHKARFAGLGEQPTREHEVAGDLIMEVLVQPDRVFRRDGADLHMAPTLTFAASVVGAIVEVPHFDGAFQVDTAQWGVLQPGVPYRVPKRGMPPGGDLVLTFSVTYPPGPLSTEQRDALRAALGGI
jgi:DnaJ family protein A protein 2